VFSRNEPPFPSPTLFVRALFPKIFRSQVRSLIGLTLDVKAKFKSKGPELTITSMACKAGIRPSTLHYYEKIGLLPLTRRVAGRRRYGACTLNLIAYAKEAGFSLAQIHESARESARPPLARPSGREGR
jgi:hypothetical protein